MLRRFWNRSHTWWWFPPVFGLACGWTTAAVMLVIYAHYGINP